SRARIAARQRGAAVHVLVAVLLPFALAPFGGAIRGRAVHAPPAGIPRAAGSAVAPAPPGTARAGIAALTRPPPAPILPARLRPLPSARTRARFDLAGGAHHGGGAVLARSAILGAGVGIGREGARRAARADSFEKVRRLARTAARDEDQSSHDADRPPHRGTIHPERMPAKLDGCSADVACPRALPLTRAARLCRQEAL